MQQAAAKTSVRKISNSSKDSRKEEVSRADRRA
jgi:hypothetical protein